MNQTVVNYYMMGANCLDNHDPHGAIGHCSNALRIDPEFEAAYFIRGVAKDDLNDFEGAIKDYTLLLNINL
jgi:hypothetical protein